MAPVAIGSAVLLLVHITLINAIWKNLGSMFPATLSPTCTHLVMRWCQSSLFSFLLLQRIDNLTVIPSCTQFRAVLQVASKSLCSITCAQQSISHLHMFFSMSITDSGDRICTARNGGGGSSYGGSSSCSQV